MDNAATLKLIYTLDYVRIVRSFLTSIGAWPGEAIGEKVLFISWYHGKQLPIQTAILLCGQISYLVNNFKTINFLTMGHMYITSFLSVLCTMRCTLPSFEQYGIVSNQFLMKFHLVHFKEKDETFKKMCAIIDRVSYFFTLYLSVMMVMGLMLFNITPMYNNFKKGAFTNRNENMTLEFSVYYVFPGFDPTDHFIPITFFNFYLSYCCSVSICSIDLFMSLMVFQIIGHILVLKSSLKNIPKPQSQIFPYIEFNKKKYSLTIGTYTADENVILSEKIKGCIDHHRLIVGFTDSMSDFFGPALATYYLFHLVSGCLLLLECSTGDPAAIARYGPLTIIIFGQLVQISIVFEIVGYVSEKLPDSVYYMPWESMSLSNQRTVSIFFQRVQTPIQVTAMGMAPVGVTTMAGILKTTFSYFMFLKSKS